MAEAILADGIEFMRMNKLEEAAACFVDAAADAPQDSIIQARCFGNLANVYARQNKNESALMFNLKALTIFRAHNKPDRVALILFNCALLEYVCNKKNDAFNHMKEVLDITMNSESDRLASAVDFFVTHLEEADAAGITVDGVPLRTALNKLRAKSNDPKLLAALKKLPTTMGTVCQTVFTPVSYLNELLKPEHSTTTSSQTDSIIGTEEASTAEVAAASHEDKTNSATTASGAPTIDVSAPSSGGNLPSPVLSPAMTPLPSKPVGGKPSSETSSSIASSIVPTTVARPRMLEYGFDNLWFGDVIARFEKGLASLDAIDGMLRARAAASEAYGRSLYDAANLMNPVLASTGLGIAVTTHSGPKQQTGMMNAFKNALFGSSAPDPLSPSEGAPGPAVEEPPSSVQSGGFDSMSNALHTLRKSQIKEAFHHHKACNALRDLSQKLQAYRSTFATSGQRHLQRGTEFVRVWQAGVTHLKKQNSVLEKARKDYDDARERYVSAKESGAVADLDLQKRYKRMQEAEVTMYAAETAARESAEALAQQKRNRDEELVICARCLQQSDAERMIVTANVLKHLTSIAGKTADLCIDSLRQAFSAVEHIDSLSDERMFIHHRRVAIMLSELLSKTGSRSRGQSNSHELPQEEAEEMNRLIPNPYDSSTAHRHRSDYIKTEAQLAPVMLKWVTALLKSEGYETLSSEIIAPETVTEDMIASQQAFEVMLLDEAAARHAFLRALSARRSVQQRVDASFHRFCMVFWWVLDACMVHEDARGAGTVLILSETFYKGTGSAELEEFSKDRLYVQAFIKAHPIWQSEFWQESFYRAVRDEVTKLIDPAASSNARLTSIFAAAEADTAVDETSTHALPAKRTAVQPSPFAAMIGSDGDAQYAYSQILFGQLMALVVNMVSFNTPEDDVKATIYRLATGNGLPKDMVEMVLDTVKSQIAASKASN